VSNESDSSSGLRVCLASERCTLNLDGVAKDWKEVVIDGEASDTSDTGVAAEDGVDVGIKEVVYSGLTAHPGASEGIGRDDG